MYFGVHEICAVEPLDLVNAFGLVACGIQITNRSNNKYMFCWFVWKQMLM